METLPVELIHRILDNLDSETIIFSIQSVSRLFQSVVHTYNRFNFNAKLISKSNFQLLCRLIKSENIISLSFSTGERIPDQIDLFLSLVHIEQFTRLRSLTLPDINEDQIAIILKRINLDQLISFSVTMKEYNCDCIEATNNLLASIFTLKNLRKLTFDLNLERWSTFSWPNHCSIKYLIITNYISINNLLPILQYSPHLHTIIVERAYERKFDASISTLSSSRTFPQLKSLTIEEHNISFDKLESFLSFTPSLVYLKLFGEENMMDGKRWEQLIQTKLSQLKKFEFYFEKWLPKKKKSAHLKLILPSFQTSFWTEYKQWFVIGEYNINDTNTFHIYTIPICKSFLRYKPEFKKLSLPNSIVTTENESTMKNNVKSLALIFNKDMMNDIEEKKTWINKPIFPNVNEIEITFNRDWSLFSLESLSIFINIVQIVHMRLKIYDLIENEKDALINIGIFLQQAHNLVSLSFGSSLKKYELYQTIQNTFSIIPRQLKHLEIPINSLNHVKMIIEHCNNLSTVKFNTGSTFSKKIIQWFNDNTINSTYDRDERILTIWIGTKKTQSVHVQHDNKRIKLTENL